VVDVLLDKAADAGAVASSSGRAAELNISSIGSEEGSTWVVSSG
jgi:hypothetical protein